MQKSITWLTSISVILPILYMLRPVFPDNMFLIVLKVAVLITALLFVTNFKFKKPNNLMLSVLVFAGVCAGALEN